MKQQRIFLYISSITVCFLLAAMGCQEGVKTPKVEKVKIALSLEPNSIQTYKSSTYSEDCVKYTGALVSEPNLKDRCNKKSTEIVYTQKILKVDEQGNTLAEITIKQIKCHSIFKDEIVMDINSVRPSDKNNPILKLVGQSYKIMISPKGEVTDVIDLSEARNVLQGNSTAVKEGLQLLAMEFLKERHSIITLPEPNNNELALDENWESVRLFDFGKLGLQAYERINTVKEIKKEDNREIAVISVDALPTTKMGKELFKKQGGSALFLKMFDNTYTYSGELEFDVSNGKVIKSSEKLDSQWVAVDPESADNTITMTAIRIRNIEAVGGK